MHVLMIDNEWLNSQRFYVDIYEQFYANNLKHFVLKYLWYTFRSDGADHKQIAVRAVNQPEAPVLSCSVMQTDKFSGKVHLSPTQTMRNLKPFHEHIF